MLPCILKITGDCQVRRGPPPQPKHVLALNGSWRADHREELGEFYDTLPEPPTFLRERAADFFREAARNLDAMGVLAKTDKHTVIRYAATLDRWYSAEEELSKNAIHYHSMTGRSGEEKAAKPTPAFAQSTSCHEQLRQLEAVLGFTPADRTRLGMAVIDRQGKTADPMSALLAGG
jgi:P27 family predicted phage terminase small subunit